MNISEGQKYLIFDEISVTRAWNGFHCSFEIFSLLTDNYILYLKLLKMFKILKNMSPEITNDPFVQRTGNQCNLRHVNDFNLLTVESHIIIVKAFCT